MKTSYGDISAGAVCLPITASLDCRYAKKKLCIKHVQECSWIHPCLHLDNRRSCRVMKRPEEMVDAESPG